MLCFRSYYSYYYNDQVKEEMVRACSTNVDKRNASGILMGKPEGKRSLGRPIRTWVDNIKMDLRDTNCGVMDWIDMAQNRDRWRVLVNTVMSLWVP
jgi:hypothetical protein